MSERNIIYFNEIIIDDNKNICVAELEELVSFKVKRIYWVNYSGTEITINQHAHIHLEQVLICISGNVNITLEYPDGEILNYNLNNSAKGLYISKLCWKKIEYLEPSIILCLASEKYNESDYIRDYNDFKMKSKEIVGQ